MQLPKRKSWGERGAKGREKKKQEKGGEALNTCCFFSENLNFRHLGGPLQAVGGGKERKVGRRGRGREGRGGFGSDFRGERRR